MTNISATTVLFLAGIACAAAVTARAAYTDMKIVFLQKEKAAGHPPVLRLIVSALLLSLLLVLFFWLTR